MHCFTAILTSLVSQALLQAALDKESSVLHGGLLLREFSSLPTKAQHLLVQCQCRCHVQLTTTGTVTGGHRHSYRAYQFDFKTTKLSNPFKSQCQWSWLFFQWEECLAQVPGGELASHHPPFKTGEKKGREHPVAIGTGSLGRDKASL
jgi:hypothetical protein